MAEPDGWDGGAFAGMGRGRGRGGGGGVTWGWTWRRSGLAGLRSSPTEAGPDGPEIDVRGGLVAAGREGRGGA